MEYRKLRGKHHVVLLASEEDQHEQLPTSSQGGHSHSQRRPPID